MAAANKIFSKVDFDKLSVRVLAVFAFVMLAYNLAACWKVYREVPLREAASRSLMAANSGYFYDSGLAEPLAVFALKTAVFFGADHDAAVRAEGLAVFAAVTALTLFVLRRRCGAIAGLMATLFLAANPYMGYYAMQGDTHLYALFFLLLFWHYFDPAGLTVRRAAWAGLYGGLACLSRLDAAWFILLAAGLSAALNFRKFDLKAAGITLGLAFILVFPYLAYQRAQYGNFFYAQELGLRRWANIDQYRRAPSAPMATAPLSVPAFVFRDGAAGAVRGAFSGLGRSLAYELPKVVYYKLIVVLVFLGFYSALILKKDALLVFLAAAFLPVLALAPINEISSTGGITLRYYLWALWAFCSVAGLGFQGVLEWTETQFGEWVAEKEKTILELEKKRDKTQARR